MMNGTTRMGSNTGVLGLSMRRTEELVWKALEARDVCPGLEEFTAIVRKVVENSGDPLMKVSVDGIPVAMSTVIEDHLADARMQAELERADKNPLTWLALRMDTGMRRFTVHRGSDRGRGHESARQRMLGMKRRPGRRLALAA